MHQAKQQGYRSRSAYKIIQIQEKFNLFKKGSKVVDLGAAPGGWSQAVSQIICSNDQALLLFALDLLDMEPIPGVRMIKGDFLDINVQQEVSCAFEGKVDVVMSDIAPNTTGERTTDHIRIIALCEQAFDFAKQHLNEKGSFVAKIFQGGTEHTLLKEIKRYFKIVKHFKPQASRQESSEMYLIATGFKGAIQDK